MPCAGVPGMGLNFCARASQYVAGFVFIRVSRTLRFWTTKAFRCSRGVVSFENNR